jgi:hypothetical protein
MIDLTNLVVSLSITGFLTYLKYRSDSNKKLMSSYQSYILYSVFILTISYGLLYYFQQNQNEIESGLSKVDSSQVTSAVEQVGTVKQVTATVEPVITVVEQVNTILDVNPALPSWD